VQVGGEIAGGTQVGVTRKLCRRMQALHPNSRSHTVDQDHI
jgi:hypothetical protein